LAWQEIFLRGYKAFDDQHWDYEARLRADEFDFAYALTVHKAQGSEWDRVLLLDESHCWKQDGTAANWLYTGITRASQQLTVVSQ
jgi:exodeoxyribonuclease-5